MLRGSTAFLARSYRVNLKYPSLVSYNKLPWEVINHETTQLHLHLAPSYEQLLRLAAVTVVPQLTVAAHLAVPEAERLRVLPGVVYLMSSPQAQQPPPGFTSYTVADPSALQYYGRLHHTLAPLSKVEVCTSGDLRLLCLALHFSGVRVAVAVASSLGQVRTASPDGSFSLYYYFRPNRPANELTRPFEKYYQHRPSLASLNMSGSRAQAPVLQVPHRTAEKATLTPAVSYRPPQNYLMGLAERLAVRPGDAFGRRSQMWGTWF